MLTTIVITPDESLAGGLERLAVGSGQVSVYKTLNSLPKPYELARIMSACDPDIVFLDVSDWKQAAPIVDYIRSQFPKAGIIGFGRGLTADIEAAFAKEGVCSLLISPVTQQQYQDCVEKTFRSARSGVHQNLMAFMPAKAGDGCSIASLNVAACLAKVSGRKLLFIEGDLHSGILSVRMKLSSGLGLRNVLANPSALNRTQWDQFVVQTHGMDILPAGQTKKGLVPKWSDCYRVLEYVDSEYDTVVVDLPETITDATAAIVLHASTVFIVCTAEAASLELARRRSQELGEWGVDPARISLILNRRHDTDISPERLRETLHFPVSAALPNDYPSVRQATDEGRLVNEQTALARAYMSMARRLAGLPEEAPAPVEPKRASSRFASLLGR